MEGTIFPGFSRKNMCDVRPLLVEVLLLNLLLSPRLGGVFRNEAFLRVPVKLVRPLNT